MKGSQSLKPLYKDPIIVIIITADFMLMPPLLPASLPYWPADTVVVVVAAAAVVAFVVVSIVVVVFIAKHLAQTGQLFTSFLTYGINKAIKV